MWYHVPTERPSDRATERRHSSALVIFSLLFALSLPYCANVKGLFTKDGSPPGAAPPHPACIGYDDEAAMPTEEGTFILCLPAHLSLMGSVGYALSADYILGNNLNLNNEPEPFTPIAGAFTGSFDGQNRKIQNLRISVNTKRAALFEELDTNGGIIQNLALEEVDVASTDDTGRRCLFT